MKADMAPHGVLDHEELETVAPRVEYKSWIIRLATTLFLLAMTALSVTFMQNAEDNYQCRCSNEYAREPRSPSAGLLKQGISSIPFDPRPPTQQWWLHSAKSKPAVSKSDFTFIALQSLMKGLGMSRTRLSDESFVQAVEYSVDLFGRGVTWLPTYRDGVLETTTSLMVSLELNFLDEL